jgi:hypothetical protein
MRYWELGIRYWELGIGYWEKGNGDWVLGIRLLEKQNIGKTYHINRLDGTMPILQHLNDFYVCIVDESFDSFLCQHHLGRHRVTYYLINPVNANPDGSLIPNS